VKTRSLFFVKINYLSLLEARCINDWDKIDENLKWVLHTQIAVLGPMYVIEDLINTLTGAEAE
jgi:hypothetical protein